jgi:hypothetical protein
MAPAIQNNLNFIQEYKHTIQENKKEINTFSKENYTPNKGENNIAK